MENNTAQLNSWKFFLYTIFRNSYIWKDHIVIDDDSDKISLAEFVVYLRGGNVENGEKCREFANAIKTSPETFYVINLFGTDKNNRLNVNDFTYNGGAQRQAVNENSAWPENPQPVPMGNFPVQPMHMSYGEAKAGERALQIKKMWESELYYKTPTIVEDPQSQYIVRLSESNTSIVNNANVSNPQDSSVMSYLSNLVSEFTDKYTSI